MKRFAVVLGGALAAAALAVAPAFASRTAASPNYVPGDHTDVAIVAHTIALGKASSLGYTPNAANQGMTNWFVPKQDVTFRAWAVDAATGKVLKAADVMSAFVKIPGASNIKLKWGTLGTAENSAQYWYGTWTIPADWKPGTVFFHVIIREKAGYKLGDFSQDTLNVNTQLTVTANPIW